MHTRHSVRWLSSVAALAAGLIGLGVPLAAPASAATSVSLSPTQPRYPVGAQATINVQVTPALAANTLSASVTNGIDAGGAVTCTNSTGVLPSTQWRCTMTNMNGTGSDTVTVTDTASGKSSSTTIGFETIQALPSQNIGTVMSPDGFYGAGETATISVLVTGANPGASLKGFIGANTPDSPGLGTKPITCRQSGGTGVYSCTFTNDGSAGVDGVTIFDDDLTTGTNGVADPGEAATGVIPINFEAITATPDLARSTPTQDVLDVNMTGVPVTPIARTPVLREVIISGVDESLPTPVTAECTAPVVVAAGHDTAQCTVVSNGRNDNPQIEVFDDFNADNAPQVTEPSSTTGFGFEIVTASESPNDTHFPGSTATINVTLSNVPAGETPSVDYKVDAGSTDPAPNPNFTLCSGAGDSWTCQITNTVNTASAVDTLTIFDDANNNRVQDGSEPSTDVQVTFGGAVTATPASGTFAVGSTAPFTAHVVGGVGETPQLRWNVAAGPDVNTNGACTPLNGGTSDWTCGVKNNGSAGVDTVHITDINSRQNPQSFTTVKATFEAATAITLTPVLATGQHSAQIATGGCQLYTADITPALTEPVTITITQDLGQAQGGLLGIGATPPAQSLSPCNVAGGSTMSVVSHEETSAGGDPILGLLDPPDYTDTLVLSGTTGQIAAAPGRVVFGVSSTTVGTVNVTASTGALSSGTQAFTVITGGQKAVTALTATPATQSVVTGGTASFSVLAQNTNGTPIPGATIDYVVAAGSPDATTAPVACPTTGQTGTTTCTLKAGATIGTDTVTFFAPQGTGETAPAVGDPQTSAKVTVATAPPAGSTLTLNCPDELVTDANALVPNCTVTTGNGGQQSVIFAAHVANSAGAALANIPVQFAVVSGPATVTSTPGNVTTNASGNAVFVVAATNPVAGDKITVSATVGTPGQGGLGPAVAAATFQAPHPTYVTATPATQQVAKGSTVNVTGKALDQFGAGVAGQTLDFSVTGRNTTSGAVTTGTAGSAAIFYQDSGATGSDAVTVTDVSAGAPATNNPAHATVTYGTGGCTTNCGGGCTTNCGSGFEHPALHVNQTVLGGGKVRLALVVISHPSLASTGVTFYQLRNGVRHKIGTGRTGGHGNVTGTLRANRGQRLRFQARVAGKGGVGAGFSNTVTVTAR